MNYDLESTPNLSSFIADAGVALPWPTQAASRGLPVSVTVTVTALLHWQASLSTTCSELANLNLKLELEWPQY